tara:strand:- start:311 stop:799 length:489 start_codon:yes stop_codon:yes gene_type:complete
MEKFKLIRHAPGAPGLRLLGLGPGLRPMNGILKLQYLLDKHSFWANGRSIKDLKLLLAKSTAVVSVWEGDRMIGFGRASGDGVFRTVLWDIVVASDLQGLGLGREIVEALLNTNTIKKTERVYLMTTKGAEFYEQNGFEIVKRQKLMLYKAKGLQSNSNESG